MYELCAPVLYSDCTPYDFTAFAAGLRTNEHIDRTARLHIHHKRHWTEPTYKDILTVGWDELEDKPILDTVPPSLDLQSVMEECQALIQEGARLRRFITEGLTILPNLRSVSMGGIGDQVFNQTGSIMIERMYSSRFEVTSKILPHALIDLPTLHHYCQAVSESAHPNLHPPSKRCLQLQQLFTTWSSLPSHHSRRHQPILYRESGSHSVFRQRRSKDQGQKRAGAGLGHVQSTRCLRCRPDHRYPKSILWRR
jgi:hypothetical protein